MTVWRDAADPIPAVASACEIYPGRTPYTGPITLPFQVPAARVPTPVIPV